MIKEGNITITAILSKGDEELACVHLVFEVEGLTEKAVKKANPAVSNHQNKKWQANTKPSKSEPHTEWLPTSNTCSKSARTTTAYGRVTSLGRVANERALKIGIIPTRDIYPDDVFVGSISSSTDDSASASLKISSSVCHALHAGSAACYYKAGQEITLSFDVPEAMLTSDSAKTLRIEGEFSSNTNGYRKTCLIAEVDASMQVASTTTRLETSKDMTSSFSVTSMWLMLGGTLVLAIMGYAFRKFYHRNQSQEQQRHHYYPVLTAF